MFRSITGRSGKKSYQRVRRQSNYNLRIFLGRDIAEFIIQKKHQNARKKQYMLNEISYISTIFASLARKHKTTQHAFSNRKLQFFEQNGPETNQNFKTFLNINQFLHFETFSRLQKFLRVCIVQNGNNYLLSMLF